jgi:phage RecT family recombinase
MNENRALVQVTQALADPEMQGKFVQMLPAEVPVDRFTEVVMMAIRQTPELLDADRQTLYDSCLSLARRGLLPDKKEAALVVYSTNVAPKGQQKRYVKKVQEIAMVGGIIKELGKVGIKAYAVSVYTNDQFDFWNDDDGQHVKHKPVVFGDRGTRIGAFAAGQLPDGRTYVEAMNMQELERVALRSKQAWKDKEGVAHRGGTWLSDPERMEQKSCLHRLRKRMPVELPPEGEDDFDQTSEYGSQPEAADIPPSSGDAAESVVVDSGTQAERAVDSAPTRQSNGKKRPRGLRAVIDQVKEPEPKPEPKQQPENESQEQEEQQDLYAQGGDFEGDIL